MSLSEPYDDRLMADLAAAADGTLPPARQAELEAMAEDDPDLAAALDEQRRAVTLIQGAAAEIRAPLALRERLENERARATRANAPPPLALDRLRRRRRRGRLPRHRSSPRPSGGRPSRTPPPSPRSPRRARRRAATGPLLDIDQDGIVFPAWAEKFGWEATGTHTGEIDGREATTVYYENADGKTLAYTIVGGDALDTPDDTTTIEVEGTEVEIFRADGTPAATWERDGHTCVLVGEGVEDEKLAELAGWQAKGEIPF